MHAGFSEGGVRSGILELNSSNGVLIQPLKTNSATPFCGLEELGEVGCPISPETLRPDRVNHSCLCHRVLLLSTQRSKANWEQEISPTLCLEPLHDSLLELHWAI